jgi:hypothetical protein
VKNLVSLSFSDEDLAAVDTALGVIEEKLAPLLSLAPDEVRGLFKMGEKSEVFCRSVLQVLDQNPQVVPQALDLDEATADLATLDALRPRLRRLRLLATRGEDTSVALGADVMAAALEVRPAAGQRQGQRAGRPAPRTGREALPRGPKVGGRGGTGLSPRQQVSRLIREPGGPPPGFSMWASGRWTRAPVSPISDFRTPASEKDWRPSDFHTRSNGNQRSPGDFHTRANENRSPADVFHALLRQNPLATRDGKLRQPAFCPPAMTGDVARHFLTRWGDCAPVPRITPRMCRLAGQIRRMTGSMSTFVGDAELGM